MRRKLSAETLTVKSAERGVTIILVAMALVVLVAMVGLALDAGQLYVTKQRAQAAADAAAQAGVLDLFDRTTPGTAQSTAVSYAGMNGFSSAETAVSTSLNCGTLAWCSGHIVLSGEDNPNVMEVTVTRTVNTSFLRVLGINASTVKATADAAIVLAPAPIPIVVTHPTLSGSFSLSGNTQIRICGGPSRALQVNSTSSSAMSVGNNSTVDLSKAGPADDSNCTTGTGADFAVIGGPAYTGFPSWLTPIGSAEHFWQPASIIYDPLTDVVAPAAPLPVNPAIVPINDTSYGCPPSPVKPCQLYSPGTYTNGINVQNNIAIFKPGLYYMDKGKGFQSGAHGYMQMCTGCALDTSINPKAPGMVVFNHSGGQFSVGSNGDVNLTGSDANSNYRGILFFQDRNSPATTHTLGGGGSLNLSGTLYMTNCDGTDAQCVGQAMTSNLYQTLRISGHAGSTTLIRGEVIASAVDLRGGGSIQMSLSPAKLPSIRSVALVR
jgi:Flp pilus assembly protein TadG